MKKFKFETTGIDGLFLVHPFVHEDHRGFLSKAYERDVFLDAGIDFTIQETLEAHSEKGVLRGLHIQGKAPQAKLVKAILGEIFDVAVDLRAGSKTYGKWRGYYLSDQNKLQLFIPKGFAHGYLVISDVARVIYYCEGKYMPEHDGGIIWNDKTINVKWPIDKVKKVILSEKDANLSTLR